MAANSTDVINVKAKPNVAMGGSSSTGGLGQTTHSPVQERRYLIVLVLVTILLATIYPLLAGSSYQGSADLHATIEAVGALFGLVAGFALVVRFYTLGNRSHLLIGLAFFVNGAEDLIHGLLSFHPLQQVVGLPASSLQQFIPGTYVTGRLFMGLILFLASFATRWLGESQNPKRETRWVLLAVLFITMLATAVAFQIPLPPFIYPDRLISRPVDFLSAIVLLAAMVALFLEYHRGRDILTWWILLSIAVNTVGQVQMSFSKSLYDAFFDIAHVYKVLGYVIPLLGFSLYQIAIISERNRAEKALIASREYSRNIIESSLDMIIATNVDRHIVEFNKAAEETFGYRREEVVGEHVDILYADAQEGLLVHETTIEEGQCVREILDRRKNGEVFPAFLSASVLRGASGEIVGIMGVARDITKQKQAEGELRESEERFRTVADFTHDWEYWLGPDGNLLYVSPSCERITGYRADEFVQDPGLLEKIVHPDDYVAFVRHLGEEFENRDALPVDFRAITRSGEERWIGHICQPVHGADGSWLGRRASNRDITGRKLMEEALWRRNKELAMLNSASRALISTLDRDQMFIIILEEVRQLLDVVACSIWLVDPETNELVCQQATGPQRESVRGWRLAPGKGLVGWTAQSGESLIVPDVRTDERHFKGVAQQAGLDLRSILSIPLPVAHKVIGVLQAVDTEVGSFGPADLELLEPLAAAAAMAIENAQLYEQARRDAETRATLLGEVNHRVKNNLTGIIGLLHSARRRARVEDRATYQATMDDLIGRVRGLATVHSMLSASGWSPLRLSDVATEIINAALQTLPRDKRVSVDVPRSPVRVTSDQAHNLALMINELATNAVKHAFGEGERETVHITFQVRLDDDTVRCEFRDDGPGYPQDVLQLERHKMGFDLIRNIVRKSLRGELSLQNDRGAVAVIRFEAKVQNNSPKSQRMSG